MSDDTILEVRDACVTFEKRDSVVHAVDHISLTMKRGAMLGLVGESGSGKSTLAKAIVGMQQLDSGQILIDGLSQHDRAKLKGHAKAEIVQMVFQDPYSSLNPRMSVGDAIGEVLDTYEHLSAAEREESVAELLRLVHLPADVAPKMPDQLSGGMRQRIAVAKCLAVRPKLIVTDEITSALDVSVQAVVLNLIRSLHEQLGLSMLFISHNLAAVRYICDDIAVMHHGRIVECGPAEQIVKAPTDPYTRSLVSAIPSLEDAGRDVLLEPSLDSSFAGAVR
ncbi:ABC transporter ATP-binding protein [Bifidobacterium callitrichidarum]|uniref:ABC transporter ATP-binding protein n=1 Tax=Bifidobacterium callitrichidarum TaxID=2052941 RepID=A0A2U2NAF6_9BIFI|nr:ABC transporter ATP-binding protein [Bifidobacterium callitrichidarum]PWG66131.1 ABC transporter ATP-binding protein [Bifidobacterium callitrichidarum]